MKISTYGLYHLGCVTTTCLARRHRYHITAIDPNPELIEELKNNRLPIFEPRLTSLMEKHSEHIEFTSDISSVKDSDIVWVTFDTPINNDDIADVEYVEKQIVNIFPYLKDNTIVLISSQLPVGTTRKLIDLCPNKTTIFAYSPENLRLGKAIDTFMSPDRIIVGMDRIDERERVAELLSPFSDNIIWMSPESAEMTKHALNAYLAMSITFINEIASICEKTGADIRSVERGLKTDHRIGDGAYLHAGKAFDGGTLARDVEFLKYLKDDTILIPSIIKSNKNHKNWIINKLQTLFPDPTKLHVAMLGTTYKTGTNTHRRSFPLELRDTLMNLGVRVTCHDPFDPELEDIVHATIGADVIIIGTDHPEYRDITPDNLVRYTEHHVVIDPNGFLEDTLGHDPRIKYITVGRKS
ncbi:MAG: nucleotide sugar dehydrogenase [Pedobacter sp.]|uniref:nucleotide sugar dehydrogenase n=1 Tax=Pedobacter sp. TaxID=1411316 RepID=UPI003561BFCB